MTTADDRRWVGSMPRAYDDLLGPVLFRPFALDLAARVARSEPEPSRVLELAAGTGIVTAELVTALPQAHVTATDLNDAMVDLGSRRAPGASWRTADAQDLPFDDGSFDLVVCQFGVMFFPDRPGAFAEVRRVLGTAPGGRFLASTWGPASEHAFAAAYLDAFAEVLPDRPVPFLTAIPHGYHDPDRIRADLAAGGFADPVIERVTIEGRGTARQVAVGFCTGTPIRAALDDLPDADEAVEAVVAALEARIGTGEVGGDMTALVVEARPLPA